MDPNRAEKFASIPVCPRLIHDRASASGISSVSGLPFLSGRAPSVLKQGISLSLSNHLHLTAACILAELKQNVTQATVFCAGERGKYFMRVRK